MELLQYRVIAGVDGYFLLLASVVGDVAPLFLRAFGLGKFDAEYLLYGPEYLHVRFGLISEVLEIHWFSLILDSYVRDVAVL